MKTPKVFLSYSHDSVGHKDWVLALAEGLRSNGIDAVLDQWDLVPGQDISKFMQSGIADADRVILVCSQSYVDKADAGRGSVGYERLVITADLVQDIDTKKFIPLVRNNGGDRLMPVFLGPRRYINFEDDQSYKERLDELLREILGVPARPKPPIGSNPFSGELPEISFPQRVASSTGTTSAGKRLLEEQWFEDARSLATQGIEKVGLNAYMEIRFGLHVELAKSQVELLSSVKASEIHTFGWPIGIVLENDRELGPKPYRDGIRAEIPIPDGTLLGRKSYDYWTLRKNGDFYLLQSLFEDGRTEDSIYFDTRIVRVTEALMFAGRLYRHLGAPRESRLSFRVTHRGLAGRKLRSAGSRHVSPRTCHEELSESEIVVEVEQIGATLVENVMQLLAPMFMLFEFQEFGDQIYADIVSAFERGRTS